MTLAANCHLPTANGPTASRLASLSAFICAHLRFQTSVRQRLTANGQLPRASRLAPLLRRNRIRRLRRGNAGCAVRPDSTPGRDVLRRVLDDELDVLVVIDRVG